MPIIPHDLFGQFDYWTGTALVVFGKILASLCVFGGLMMLDGNDKSQKLLRSILIAICLVGIWCRI